MDTIDLTTRVTATALAGDVNRDATPEFKEDLVIELFRLDPFLELVVLNRARRKAQGEGN
jgi:hypothetical protein